MQKEFQESLSEYGLTINFLDELRQFVKEITGHYVSGRANDETLEERLQFQLGDGIMGFQGLMGNSIKNKRAEMQQRNQQSQASTAATTSVLQGAEAQVAAKA